MNHSRLPGDPTRCKALACTRGGWLALRLVVGGSLLVVPPALAASEPVAQPTGTPVLANDATGQRAQAYYHLMRAMFAAHGGSLREAIDEIRRATKSHPESADLQAESAGLLLSLGRSAEAEKLARTALRIDPEHPAAVRLLADLAARRAIGGLADPKSREEAIRLYEILVRDPEVDVEVLRILANLKFQAGDTDGAVKVARRLAESRAGDAAVVHMLSQMLHSAGRDIEALETLLDYVGEYGGSNRLIETISALARATGAWEQVESVLVRQLERNPDAVDLRKIRGEALLQLGRWPEAVLELERVREANPDDAVVRLHLVSAYGRSGRLADSAAIAGQLVEEDPGNPSFQAMLGEALTRQGRLGAAVEAWERALDVLSGATPGNRERRDTLRWNIAALYQQQDLLDEAKRVIDSLEQPNHPEALEMRFRIALGQGDPEAARRAGRLLRGQDRPGIGALLEGELLLREGRVSKARAKFKEAIDRLGADWRPRVADTWRQAGHVREGEKLLRAWVREDPDGADAHFSLGSFYERTMRFSDAEPELREVIRLDPRHADALNYLGYSLADRNERLEEALDLVRRALEIDPWNGAYLDSLGWVYYRLGRFVDAREPLERAALEYPRDATVLEHLGDLYDQLGERELALGAWRRALDSDPLDPEALRHKIEAGSLSDGTRWTGAQQPDDDRPIDRRPPFPRSP